MFTHSLTHAITQPPSIYLHAQVFFWIGFGLAWLFLLLLLFLPLPHPTRPGGGKKGNVMRREKEGGKFGRVGEVKRGFEEWRRGG